MALRAVLFDVDGTLLDTREFILRAFEHAAEHLGFALPARDVMALQIGRPLETIYAELVDPRAVDAAVELHRSFQSENLDLVRPFPGVAETLRAVCDLGLQLAAVSSRSRRTLRPSLEIGGLADSIHAFVGAEDAPALKPDPAPLLRALEALSVEPRDATMVGDTEHDVRAGQSLSMPTVAVTYGIHGLAVLEAGPTWHIDRIDGLLPVLEGLIAQGGG